MATLVFDLDTSVYTKYFSKEVSIVNSGTLYNNTGADGWYATIPMPTPPYKGFLAELTYNSGYKNSMVAQYSFDTSLITTANVVTSAKLLLSGKKGTLTDNVVLEIYNGSAYTPPSVNDTYSFITSIQLSTFPSDASEIREITIPSHKLSSILRTTSTKFVLTTNLATNRVLPTGVNQFTFGHDYVTEPATPLKIQLVIEVIATNPTPSTPIVFDTITAPGRLPSTSSFGTYTVDNINGTTNTRAYTEGGVQKTALHAGAGFITINSSSIANPTIESIVDLRTVYPNWSAYKTTAISDDGTRAFAKGVVSGTALHSLILLRREGNTYVPAGELDVSMQNYAMPIIVKKGTRYIGIVPGSNVGMVISDITNFVIPDTGAQGTIPFETYPVGFPRNVRSIKYVETATKNLVMFDEYSKASINIVDVTNPGAVGNLVSTCPISTLDLTPFGYIDYPNNPTGTLPGLISFSVAKHPTNSKTYVTCIKQQGDYQLNQGRIVVDVFELTDSLQLTNKKSYEVYANIPGNIKLLGSVFSFATEKTAYSLFLSSNGGLYPQKDSLLAFDLEKANLIDVSYVNVPTHLEFRALQGIYNPSPKTLSLFVGGAPYGDTATRIASIFASYTVSLKEEGVVVPPPVGGGPVVNTISFTPSSPSIADTVTVGVNASAGSGGAIVSYEFNFGDGSSVVTTAVPTTTHKYTSGGTYSIIVKATDASGGTGAKNVSLVVTGTVVPNPVAPGVPRNLSAITTNGAVTLSWLPPLLDGGAPIVSYSITKTFGAATDTITTPDGSYSYTITGLTNGESYSFSVAAINSVPLVGPYTPQITIVVSTSVLNFDLVPWKQVNGTNINYGFVTAAYVGPEGEVSDGWQPFPVQTNSLNAIIKSSSMTELYETPPDAYGNTEELGKFSLKNVFRKEMPVVVGNYTSYKEAPSFVISDSYKAFIENMIRAVYGAGPMQPPVWATWPMASVLASLSALPGDVVNIFDYTHSLYDSVTPPSNTVMEDVWRYNTEDPACTDPAVCPLPGFPYTYAISRPFLMFNTTSVSQSSTIVKVVLKATLDDTRKAIFGFNHYHFHKALISSNDNITTADFNAIEPVSSGSQEVPRIIGGGGGCYEGEDGIVVCEDNWIASADISVELDPTIITKNGFTKIAILTDLDYNTLPDTWYTATYKDVSLEVTVGIDEVTLPGPVINLSATPSDKKVTLNWDPPISDGGAAVTSYIVKNTDTGDTISINNINNRTYTFTNLTNEVEYTFSVLAVNAQGEGQPSFVIATPSATSLTAPGPVTNLDSSALNGAVALSWNSPSLTGGTPILNYEVLCLETDERAILGPTSYNYVVTGLTNGTTYTFRVHAINAIGNGPVSTVFDTPTNSTTVPPPPTILSVTPTLTNVTVAYIDTGDGGSDLLQWFFELTNLTTGTKSYFTLTDPAQLSYVLTGLQRYTPYRLGVAAVNVIGASAWAYTEPFALNDGSDGGLTIKVPVNFNYNMFYPAPVELNDSSSNYLNYLYPESVWEDTPAFVQSIDTSYPIKIKTGSNNFYVTVVNRNYVIEFPITVAPSNGMPLVSSNPSDVTIVSFLNSYFIQNNVDLSAFAINNQLILRSLLSGPEISISFSQASSNIDQLNTILFGVSPLFVNGNRIYHVENNVPTSSYDSSEQKALIESRPSVPVRSVNVKASFAKEQNDSNNTYSLQMPNNKIKPNSVTIYYYGDNNNTVFLRDYLGDGYLRVRIKEPSAPGDAVTFSYFEDPIAKTDIFGIINYETGVISNILFPTTLTSNGYVPTVKSPLVIGNKVTWPLRILPASALYLIVNGTMILIPIPEKSLPADPDAPVPLYSLTEMITYLNAEPTFVSKGLLAGNSNGQLYIKNLGYPVTTPGHSGPDVSISLANSAYYTNNLNYALFGLQPKYITSSPFYLTYTYLPNYESIYKHVWYQTPHFALVSKGSSSTFTTFSHLKYLLEKLNITRPSTTILDGITFSPVFDDISYTADTLTVVAAEGVEVPYIEASNIPGQVAGLYPVEVINPDLQMFIGTTPETTYTYL